MTYLQKWQLQWSPVALLALLITTSGCGLYMPAHDRSYDLKGERTSFKFLTDTEFNSAVSTHTLTRDGAPPAIAEYRINVDEPFDEKGGAGIAPAIAALLAPLVAGIAEYGIGLLSAELEDASAAFEAQFEANGVGDHFWRKKDKAMAVIKSKEELYTGRPVPGQEGQFSEVRKLATPFSLDKTSIILHKNSENKYERYSADDLKSKLASKEIQQFEIPISYEQHYRGFQITRSTEATNESFIMLFEILPTIDQQVLMVRPVFLHMESSKAKVLDARWWNYWIPLTWSPVLFMRTDHSIDLEIALTFDNVWVDSADKTQKQKNGEFSLKAGTYNIEKCPQIYYPGWKSNASNGGLNVVEGKSTPLFTLPFPSVSMRTTAAQEGSGILEAKAVITQKDTSQSKKYIKKFSDVVEKKKEEVIKVVVEAVKGKDAAEDKPAGQGGGAGGKPK